MVLSQPQFIYMRRLLPLLRHAEREKSDKGGGRRKSILKFASRAEKSTWNIVKTPSWRLLRYATCSTEATCTLPNFTPGRGGCVWLGVKSFFFGRGMGQWYVNNGLLVKLRKLLLCGFISFSCRMERGKVSRHFCSYAGAWHWQWENLFFFCAKRKYLSIYISFIEVISAKY